MVEELILVIWLFAMGAVLGSYAAATVWRLRAKELAQTKPTSSKQQRERKKLVERAGLSQTKILDDYSRCLHCGHRLAWYDLLPVVSWISLRGCCRYCRKAIGWTEFLAEVSLGLIYAISFWLLKDQLNYVSQFLWLGLLVILAILFIYDAKWQLLPTKILWLGITWAIIFAGYQISVAIQAGDFDLIQVVTNYGLAWLILGGLYYVLAKLSNQRWVGGGDAYVGTIMALVLGDYWLAFVALFIANLLGCVVVGSDLLIKRLKRKSVQVSTIALGPLLIVALVVVVLFRALILTKIIFFLVDI